MKQRACTVFRDQRVAYALRFTCEHCTYFAERNGACSHGYPNHAHREAQYEAGAATRAEEQAGLEEDVELIFCKDFELR